MKSMTQNAVSHYSESIQIERHPMGSYDEDGRYVRSAPLTIESMATVEPIASLKDRELQQLPEGERNEAEIVVWINQPVYITDSEGSDEHLGFSDVVIYQGERYKVLKIQRRSHGGFYRAICGLYRDRKGEQRAGILQ